MHINISTQSVIRGAQWAVAATVISACSMLYFYREIHELAGMQWFKSDTQQFDVQVESPKKLDGRLIIRHVEGYQHSDLTVHVVVENNGEVWMDEHMAIPIKDENGDYLGSGSVDLWDVEHPLFQGKTLSKGNYTFKVDHTMQQDRLPLVMEVGLVLEEV
jgi:gliding motility-associated lipoprotein GldH